MTDVKDLYDAVIIGGGGAGGPPPPFLFRARRPGVLVVKEHVVVRVTHPSLFGH